MPEIVACPLCRGSNAVSEPRKSRFLVLPRPFEIAACLECGTRFLSPRPTLEELGVAYQRHPYYAADSALRGAPRRAFYGRRIDRLERVQPEYGSLLGVACLDGGYQLLAAAERGWRVKVVEFAPHQARHAQELLGLDVELSGGWALEGLRGQRFDSVMSMSLEHVPDPRATIAACKGLLRPGGIAVFEVPNQFHSLKDVVKEGAIALSLGLLDRYFYREVAAEFHLTYFTPTTFRRALELEGFEVLELRTYLPEHPVYLRNPRFRGLQEGLYRVGGWVGRGPSMEVIARAVPS